MGVRSSRGTVLTMNIKHEATRTSVATAIQQLTYVCHQNSVEHGFYEGREFNLGEKGLLIVSEIVEAFEGDRNGKATMPDEHCPEYTNFEIEVADACIRIFDLAEYRKLRLGQAILSKMDYNASRPYKHNKNY